MTKRRWRKSSHSGGDSTSGDCVELGYDDGEPAAVRDSKDPEGGVIELPGASWRALFAQVRSAK